MAAIERGTASAPCKTGPNPMADRSIPWWTRSGSNRRPRRCERRALSTELLAPVEGDVLENHPAQVNTNFSLRHNERCKLTVTPRVSVSRHLPKRDPAVAHGDPLSRSGLTTQRTNVLKHVGDNVLHGCIGIPLG